MNWLLPSLILPRLPARTVLLMNAQRDDKELTNERRAKVAAAKQRSRKRIGRRGW